MAWSSWGGRSVLGKWTLFLGILRLAVGGSRQRLCKGRQEFLLSPTTSWLLWRKDNLAMAAHMSVLLLGGQDAPWLIQPLLLAVDSRTAVVVPLSVGQTLAG